MNIKERYIHLINKKEIEKKKLFYIESKNDLIIQADKINEIEEEINKIVDLLMSEVFN